MKKLINILCLTLTYIFILSCSKSTFNKTTNDKEKPVIIANDSLEYEITIIDIGFNNYLNTIARPVGFHSQSYLENRNKLYVTAWNYRAQNPTLFDPNIYENVIDYNSSINYGYDVNYKLFNYFEFAQRKYRMSLVYNNGRFIK